MKKLFEEPQLEVIRFDFDVLTEATSSCVTGYCTEDGCSGQDADLGGGQEKPGIFNPD